MLRKFRLKGVLDPFRQTILNNVRLNQAKIEKLAIDADYQRIHITLEGQPRYQTIGEVPQEHQDFLRQLQTGNFSARTQVVGGGWMILDELGRDVGRYADQDAIARHHAALVKAGVYQAVRLKHGLELTFTDAKPPLPHNAS